MPFPQQMSLHLGIGGAKATRTILIGTVVAFFVQLVLEKIGLGGVVDALALSRAGIVGFRLWQFVTYTLLHGGPWHLLMNMFLLAMFGRDVEMRIGARRFAFLYFVSGALAGVGWLLLSGTSHAQCIGASGAVFAVLAAFAGLQPKRQITLLLFFVIPVTMTARTMAIGLGLMTVVLAFYSDSRLVSGGERIAHTAHLVGGMVGYLSGRYYARHGARGGGSAGPLAHWMAKWRRTKMHLAGEEELPPTPQTLDRLLDKIHGQGIESLTRREREFLEEASRQVGRDDSRDDVL